MPTRRPADRGGRFTGSRRRRAGRCWHEARGRITAVVSSLPFRTRSSCVDVLPRMSQSRSSCDEPLRSVLRGQLPAFRNLAGPMCRLPVFASRSANLRLGPGVPASGRLADAVQRLGDSVVRPMLPRTVPSLRLRPPPGHAEPVGALFIASQKSRAFAPSLSKPCTRRFLGPHHVNALASVIRDQLQDGVKSVT